MRLDQNSRAFPTDVDTGMTHQGQPISPSRAWSAFVTCLITVGALVAWAVLVMLIYAIIGP